MTDLGALLQRTAAVIADYRDGLSEARVFPAADADAVRAGFDGPLPEHPTPAGDVVDALVRAASPGLVASAGPRYFGFVTGGTLDAALCADLLAVGWDQLAYNATSSPASAAAEQVAGRWLTELFALPATSSVGFVTGAQGANTVCLAAARYRQLERAGWDVARDGLRSAPAVRVLAGAERHATIDRSLRLLGLGDGCIEAVPVDEQGAMRADALAGALAAGDPGPIIVCAQAGNVATGAFDPFDDIVDAAQQHGAWVHVDGAFGLWAAVSEGTSHLTAGMDRADSWACDGHKWLNVPYDSGFAICADPVAHASAMNYTASYLTGQGEGAAVAGDLTPESSRRARGFAVWAALRELGREGIADLVDRCCRLARRFADQLAAADGVGVVNDVVLNQVLVHFGDDAHTDRVVARVQRDGTCWMGATTWGDRRLMRISVSNWTTTDADVDRCVAAILEAHRTEP
ncbi:MAG: pyridoxal phosphate-dependent decarboxylase family protein [Acidimicrobiia bacterium]